MHRGAYLDWAATAPPEKSWLAAGLEAALEAYGNPSSAHEEGKKARAALEAAREKISRALSGDSRGPGEIVFTSGATESNAIVLSSLLLRRAASSIALSRIEHPSLWDAVQVFPRLGISLSEIRPEPDGRISPARAAAAAERRPKMIALMALQNETGALQDLKGLVAAIRSVPGGESIHIHSDAVQALGKLPFSPAALGLDSAAFSAHKLGGPRGLGFLWLGRPLEVLSRGGGQEKGLRPGTENLAGAVAAALALESAKESLEANAARARSLMAAIISGIRSLGGRTFPADRALDDPRFSPYIVQAMLPGIPGEVLVRELSDRGVYISTGSACASGKSERRTLTAMGVSEDESLCAFRVSIGRLTSGEDIEALLQALESARDRLGAA